MKCASCGATLPAGIDECPHCQTLNDTDFRLLGQARVTERDQSDVGHDALGGPGRPDGGAGRHARVESGDHCSEQAQCPRCHAPLMTLNIQMGESFPVQRCKRCLGTFFGHSDLNRLVNSVASGKGLDPERVAQLCRETPREIWPITYIPCPDCRATMLRSGYGKTSGVIVDECKDHGVWLDGGELGRLLNWARAGGPQKGQPAPSSSPEAPSDIVIHSVVASELALPQKKDEGGVLGALRRVFRGFS